MVNNNKNRKQRESWFEKQIKFTGDKDWVDHPDLSSISRNAERILGDIQYICWTDNSIELRAMMNPNIVAELTNYVYAKSEELRVVYNALRSYNNDFPQDQNYTKFVEIKKYKNECAYNTYALLLKYISAYYNTLYSGNPDKGILVNLSHELSSNRHINRFINSVNH